MTVCDSDLPYDFYSRRSLVVRFSDLELSSDAGILLARQAEQQMQVCQAIADCIEEWRDPNKITHSLSQLVSQRVYQIVGGYEDANDSNHLRHDPIYKLACERLPLPDTGPLASQPTITRLENHISQREVSMMRSRMIDGFIAQYPQAPKEIVLDIDGWDDPRRLVMKVEWLPKGPNPRFMLTNLDEPAQTLYDDFYVQRGAESEHRIKELKLGIQADRLSCHNFIANQFRLLLSQAAYILLLAIRQAAKGTQLATAQVPRLQAMLIKGAARVRVSTRRVLVELAAYCPFARELRQITQRLVS